MGSSAGRQHEATRLLDVLFTREETARRAEAMRYPDGLKAAGHEKGNPPKHRVRSELMCEARHAFPAIEARAHLC